MGSQLEPLFHALELELLIPAAGVGAPPSRESELREWWDDVRGREKRDTAFLDEKLSYAVALTLPSSAFADPESDIASADPASRSAGASTPAELRTLARNVQLTATASFLPPQLSQRNSQPPNPRLSHPAQNRLSVASSGPATPTASTNANPGPPTAAPGGSAVSPARPPVSPIGVGPAPPRGAEGGAGASARPPPSVASTGSAGAGPGPASQPGTPTTTARFQQQQQQQQQSQQQPQLQNQASGAQARPGVPRQNSNIAQSNVTPAALADGAPPLTPVPLPFTTGEDARYAAIEGVTIWEGAVETPDDSRPVVFKTSDGWTAVWRGEVPVVYVRTQIANPVFALTVSATLREGGAKKKGGVLNDAASIITTQTEEAMDEDEEQHPDFAEMEEIDLFGGLVEDRMPASRLGPSLRNDLNLAPVLKVPSASPVTPIRTGTGSGGSTLRKSFRRVLDLSSGLRVRMRTLFLPQLLPPGSANDIDSEEGERRIVVCVEVENGPDAAAHDFEVRGVAVEVGGKGAKASTELLCQPGQDAKPPRATFPLSLAPLEQYNLLYLVSIAAAAERSKADEHRPVTIVLTGRPRRNRGDEFIFPTAAFESRWNCALDLGPFYASLPPAPPAPAASAPAPRHAAHRISKPTPPTPNAIAGDKRYSLAALLANDTPKPRLGQRPFVPSQLVSRVVSARGAPLHTREDGHGLLVSVKLLGSDASSLPAPSSLDEADGGAPRIRALDTFSVEVFVHNRTDAVRRFRLSIPARADENRVREAWQRRRKRQPEEQTYGADDIVLAAMLAQHESAAPALIPLETDIRCGPLLPGASLSTRIRFLALREGTHRIERLRLTGNGDEFDFVISPVLEVVVS